MIQKHARGKLAKKTPTDNTTNETSSEPEPDYKKDVTVSIKGFKIKLLYFSY